MNHVEFRAAVLSLLNARGWRIEDTSTEAAVELRAAPAGCREHEWPLNIREDFSYGAFTYSTYQNKSRTSDQYRMRIAATGTKRDRYRQRTQTRMNVKVLQKALDKLPEILDDVELGVAQDAEHNQKENVQKQQKAVVRTALVDSGVLQFPPENGFQRCGFRRPTDLDIRHDRVEVTLTLNRREGETPEEFGRRVVELLRGVPSSDGQ